MAVFTVDLDLSVTVFRDEDFAVAARLSRGFAVTQRP
jgi:hypothetical protein